MIDPVIEEQVWEAIKHWGPAGDEEFDHLCLEIARAQGLEITPHGRGIGAIVPVPEGAFKLMTVACFPPSSAQAEFHTSGTTSGRPGRHLVRSLSLYAHSNTRGFGRFVMYEPGPTLAASLIPPPAERPHSSLSRMIGDVAAAFFPGGISFLRSGERLDPRAVHAFLEKTESAGEPALLVGTTLDFAALFELLEQDKARYRLGPGSRAMHTGGSKGRKKAVDRESLKSAFSDYLGIPDVIEEYGMTELMSQAYDSPRVTGGPRRFVTVPWMKTRVLDPLDMSQVPDGAEGVLCHYDLANCHTAVAILTMDVARRVGNGFFGVRRKVGAPGRGCSADAAEVWRDP